MVVIERWSSHIGWSLWKGFTVVVYIYCTLKKLSCLVFALKKLSCLLLSDVNQNNGLFNEIAVLLSETVL
jgi:hypothetical protein